MSWDCTMMILQASSISFGAPQSDAGSASTQTAKSFRRWSILIHFGISIHFAHIWSDRGQMLDVKTTLRRFSLRGCANSNKCSWRTAKAPVTQLRRDWFDGLFRRTPEPGWVFAGQTQGIAPSRHHRVQESVPQMLSTSTEVTEILFISHVFFSNDFFNLKSIWTKGYCWSFDM